MEAELVTSRETYEIVDIDACRPRNQNDNARWERIEKDTFIVLQAHILI